MSKPAFIIFIKTLLQFEVSPVDVLILKQVARLGGISDNIKAFIFPLETLEYGPRFAVLFKRI